MLVRLLVKNFALIDDLTIEFDPGFNVLTGETGAGKSLVIDALCVVLGRRASADLIRTGCEKTILEAVFDLDAYPALADWLAGEGYDLEEGLLVLSREIWRSGRNVCRANGRTITVNTARAIGQRLVDFHGQGEHQSLLKESRHRAYLDYFGGRELLSVRSRVKDIYGDWAKAASRLEELETGAKERARRLDMLQYQIDEIDRAEPLPGEDDRLEQERELLANAEQIAVLAGEAYEALYGGDGPIPSGVDRLGAAVVALDRLARVYREAEDISEQIHGILAEAEEVARRISELRDRAEYDPARLNSLEERLSLLRRLKAKYGDTIEAVLAFRDAAAAEYAELQGGDDEAEALADRVKQLAADWREEARRLTSLRKQTAERFCASVIRELADLEMKAAVFEVRITPQEEISPEGADAVLFLFSANPGEPPRSLSKIASGGELSRVMLALKTLLAEVDEVPTLVFDEVDVGVGGRALQAVGEKLAEIAQRRQVLCVTHAAQVACYAGRHLSIRKEAGPDYSRTLIAPLSGEARLEELARMLAGRRVTEKTRALAAELRRRGRKNRAD